MRCWLFAILWIVCSCFISHNVIVAKTSNEVITPHTTASIISGLDNYDGRSEIWLGLRLQLKPGWHTYWINPGDAGEPASVLIKTSGAAQRRNDYIEWPAPLSLSENGLQSYVYTGDVVLPIHLSLKDIVLSKNLSLQIKASWLVCADICVPEEGQFVLELSEGKGIISLQDKMIQQAISNIPKPSHFNVQVSPEGILWIRDLDINPEQIQKIWFMPEKSGIFGSVADQKLILQSGRIQLSLPLLTKDFLKEPLSGVLAIEDIKHHIQYNAVTAKIAPFPIQDTHYAGNKSLIILIGSAFLGGILLNLMPCVFPVIAMKLLSLSRIGQEHILVRYKSSIAYTAGILCSFILMACAFVGLRWMGSQLGWGFQFQSVGFVVLLCWLLFVISLNFLGVFNVQFSLNHIDSTAKSSGYSSDFFTGLLAVLVATPCTAPFMGIAIAGALNAPLWISILIFIGMGLGLALPYVLFACVPSFARALPRPGLWMDILKQILAFPLLLSCLWLAWVVYQHQQPMSLLVLLTGFVGLGFIGWGIGIIQQLYMKGIYRIFRIFISGLILLIITSLGSGFYFFVHDQPTQSVASIKEDAIPFSEQKLEELRREHKPVFVNLTASWCLTCMVNDKVALSSEKVQKAFKNQHITYMVGDWTQYDKSIGDFLKAHGREGVPLYIYYPVEGSPRILPQILTPQIVINYLFDPKK